MLSVSILRSYLGISSDEHDALLDIIERGVVARLEDESGRSFATPQEVVADVLDVPRPRPGGLVAPTSRTVAVTLERDPSGALVSVEYRTDLGWVAQDLAGFELDGAKVYWMGAGVEPLPPGRRTVRVTYPHGYAVDQGPADAQLVALKLVAFVWQRRASGHGVLSGAQLGTPSVKFFEGLPRDLQRDIEALRPSLLGGLV